MKLGHYCIHIYRLYFISVFLIHTTIEMNLRVNKSTLNAGISPRIVPEESMFLIGPMVVFFHTFV